MHGGKRFLLVRGYGCEVTEAPLLVPPPGSVSTELA